MINLPYFSKTKLSGTKLNLLLITLMGLFLGWQLLRTGYYPMHDDLQVMRLYQMDRCFRDGQIPCRWAPDMANGYGQPMFNFYSAFPYYLGELLHLIGIPFVDVVKLLFLISIILSGIFTYLLAKEFFAHYAALIAAVAFITAPYHILDIYVRGAMSETWALTLLPGVLYSLVRLVRNPNTFNALFTSICIAAFLSSHNISTLISAPFIFTFTLIVWILSPRLWFSLRYLVPAVLLGLGLSSFFLLPVFLEKHLINPAALTTDYFEFHSHFTTIRQLFLNLDWAYGPSKFGPDDDISFAVGLIHLLGILLSPLALFIQVKAKNYRLALISLFFMGLTAFSILMTHGKSVAIWDHFPVLAFVQFPWRFLGLAALGSSILLSAVLNTLPKSLYRPVTLITLILLISLNFSYFRFEKYFYWITDDLKLSGELFQLQARAALLDYLPESVTEIPTQPAPVAPHILEGKVDINYFDKRSNYFSTEVDIYTDQATLQFPVMYFPSWKVYLNRQPNPVEFSRDNPLNLITITLPKGHHLVQSWFENTPIRTISNSITFSSFCISFIWFIFSYSKKNDQKNTR